MSKKIIAFCIAVVMVSSFVAAAGDKNSCTDDMRNVSTAVIEPKYNGSVTRDEAADMNDTVATTVPTTAASSSGSSGLDIGGLGDLLGGSGGSGGGLLGGSGGLGDLGSFGSAGEIFGDAGDVIGSIFGNNSNNNNNNQNTVPVTQNSGYGSNYLDPVPAATYVQSQTPTIGTSADATPTSESETVLTSAEGVVDMGTTSNPYKKPSEDINPGDSSEGVKWVQWILQFTNYGLQGKTIDGVYDDETAEVVKKFQKEQGLTDDGVINSATVDKLELMYYRYSMTLTTVAPTVSTTASQITDEQPAEDDKGIPVAAIVAIIAGVWVIAIGVVVAILVTKKKKDKAAADSADKPSGESSGDMNLSDLFEEANKE